MSDRKEKSWCGRELGRVLKIQLRPFWLQVLLMSTVEKKEPISEASEMENETARGNKKESRKKRWWKEGVDCDDRGRGPLITIDFG